MFISGKQCMTHRPLTIAYFPSYVDLSQPIAYIPVRSSQHSAAMTLAMPQLWHRLAPPGTV